jgi:hypothetical protein
VQESWIWRIADINLVSGMHKIEKKSRLHIWTRLRHIVNRRVGGRSVELSTKSTS